jgi:hypothetical protein
MRRRQAIMYAAATLSFAAACYNSGSAAGDISSVDPAAAAKSVVLSVKSQYSSGSALYSVENGQSRFIGSVGANDSTEILLDPSLFPTGFLYITAVPGDGQGRAVVGPLAASKGDKIVMNISPDLRLSRATVRRPQG